MTEIQKRMIKEKCPACKVGNLRVVDGTAYGDTEVCLWCDTCDCSIDGSGGYIT